MSKISFEQKQSALWRALLFIQNNLDGNIPLEKLAEIADFSPYHFHRLFKEFTGESVKSYIRRLRLENAAFRLKTQKEQVIDIAFDSGYYTHETFTRAFNKKFGLNPLKYKQSEKKRYNDTYINEIKLVYFKKRNCIFKRYIGPYETSGTPIENKSLWHQLMGYLPKDKQDLEDLELFGISHDDPTITETNNIRYDACIAIPDNGSLGTTSLSLPEGTYAAASHTGPFETLTESYHYLIYNWLDMYRYTMDLRTAPFEQFHLEKKEKEIVIKSISIFIPIKNR